MPNKPQPEPTRPLRVLFVHPSYPNTFSGVLDALALRPGLQCGCMVENQWRSFIQADQPRLMYFGFDTPESLFSIEDVHLRAHEYWMSRGRGVALALRDLIPHYHFDVIVSSASSGCALYLRQAVPSAIVAYCEQPSYVMWEARKEFPPTFENDLYDITYQSMLLTSVIHSDLGLVASQHARGLFPAELREKVRVQNEAFVVHSPPGDRGALREEISLPAEGPLIAFFGRSLEAVRGFDIFLKAARQVMQTRSDTHVLVIGREETRYGNELAYLNEISFKQYALSQAGISEEDIIWRDMLSYEEFLKHLACLDLAILPIFEGASNWSFFEAMAAGVPILASNRSYIPEAMRHGKEGYLFDPYDVEGFATKALELLDDPDERHRIGQNAQKRIKQRFTPDHVADGYERIIREAHARNKARLGKAEEEARGIV